MTSPYEEAQRIKIEENTKRMKALNLPSLSQSLCKSSTATSKPSSISNNLSIYLLFRFLFGKGHSRFVRPGELEKANKKRLRSSRLPQAPPHVTTPPTPPRQLTILPAPPSHVTAPASPPTNVTLPPAIDQEASPHHDIPPLDSEDVFCYEMSRKNAANRAKLKMNHSLGTKSIARTQHDLEKRDGRKYSRVEMFGVSYKTPDGSFVNDEAKEKNDQLQAEIAKTNLENEAFVKVFGKEHGGFARTLLCLLTAAATFMFVFDCSCNFYEIVVDCCCNFYVCLSTAAATFMKLLSTAAATFMFVCIA
ncbi:Asparagine-rich protein (ARP protein) [Trifolium repens]|nr:Asparagine-rich protein (ARP protein) [Trifolium repens]